MDSYVFFAPNAFQISLNTANMTVFGGLRAPTIHHQQCTEKCFSDRSFFSQRLSRKEVFTHRSSYTPMLYAKMLCTAQHCRCPLHTEAFTHRRSHTHTHKSFYTEKLVHKQLLHEEVSSPPQKKSGKQVFELGSFSFPVVSLPDNEC